MLKLYHHTMSVDSRFIRLILSEYEESVEFIEELTWLRRSEFLKLNPANTLPVLIEENQGAQGTAPICGAMVIAEYLDETRGALKRERRLFPESPAKRAEVRRIMNWVLVKLENEVTRYMVHERVIKSQIPRDQGGGAPDSTAIRAARANIKYHIKYLGWLATTRDWLGGDRLSYADLSVGAAISVLDYLGEVPWSENDALKEWYACLKSRPSFRPLLNDKIRGLPPVSHYVDLDF
jgi:glutathione S-transferase